MDSVSFWYVYFNLIISSDLHRYVVTINTSSLPSAGTDAVVYLKLCGINDCPELKIYGASDNNPKAFKTGQ